MKKHINIYPNHKLECCGCTACVSSCPRKCIEIIKDELGLEYPVVNDDSCIECGICSRVCPFINVYEYAKPMNCYAAMNNDDIVRLNSSSGGVFYAIASKIISEGGIVFGVVFDESLNVKHVWSETIDGILPMMGSKYLQSRIEDSYQNVKIFLERGRIVLFTGTPCQVAGLNHYLGKAYDKLHTIEVICHGVPSPAVWQSYMTETFVRPKGGRVKNTVLPSPLMANTSASVDVKFRDKRFGWKKYGFAILPLASFRGEENSVLPSYRPIFYEPFYQNAYMKVFLKNWSLRPSCYNCKAKSGASHADITIGDYWGVDRSNNIKDDDGGISCVICRSEKGYELMKMTESLNVIPTEYEIVLQGNPSLEKSVSETKSSTYFHKKFHKKGFYKTIVSIEQPPIYKRILASLRYRILKSEE